MKVLSKRESAKLRGGFFDRPYLGPRYLKPLPKKNTANQ